MRIIKDNFYTVVKLWITQFAMMFLGILVLLPTANMKFLLSESHPDAKGEPLSWMMPIASVFVILFYLVLIFWCCCEVGLNDSVKIESGRMKLQWYKCTLLALIAGLPSLVASIIACVAKTLIPGVSFLSSAEGAAGAAASTYGVSMTINEILNIMYKGTFIFFGIDELPFIYFFSVFLSVAVCTLGYIAGTKGMFANLLSRKKDK